MKKAILIPIALLITVLAMAQDRTFDISLNAGVSMPTYSYKYNGISSKRSIYQGYTGGVFIAWNQDISFISIALGLNYLQAGAINKAPLIANTVESKNRINYFQVEAYIFKFKPIKLIEMRGGFYFNTAMSGEAKMTKTDGTITKNDFKFGIAEDYNFHKGDLGLTGKLFINISRLKLSAAYQMGFDNISAKVPEEIKNRIFTVGVGYKLGK
jgi:hypothetical protein